MKLWENRAIALLDKSLSNIAIELNEIDWKSQLSDNSDKLAKHLSAFSHLSGGGFIVFGINNNGTFTTDLDKHEIDEIIRKLGNIANMSLSVAITLDHMVSEYKGHNLLFVFIPESPHKPISLRGDNIYECYKRSAGQTVKMSSTEVKALIAYNSHITFEEQIAKSNVSADEVIRLLDFVNFFRLLDRPLPDNKAAILDSLVNEGLVKINSADTYHITNLGAILFALNLNEFKDLKRKVVRVIFYKGTNKVDAIKEQIGKKGYAIGFHGLLQFVLDRLPTNEVIEKILRTEVKMYPEVALREFVANALIHQDFSMTGTGTMIEIYKDRIEITNPGIPLIDTNRFIGGTPRSRNETLASLMRRLRICEERGSGVIRAVAAIEVYQLPAPKFIKEEDYTKVIIYAHRTLAKMSKEDRIRACYQHACLQHASSQVTNNESLRKRFNIEKSNYPMASKIIADTLESGLIKPTDVKSSSKKHATYLPYYA